MLLESEVISTLQMVKNENLDVRTVTLGVSLFNCASDNISNFKNKVYQKLIRNAKDFVSICNKIGEKYGITVVNKRIAVSPISIVAAPFSVEELIEVAEVLDVAAQEVGIDFIGGFSALVEKGIAPGDLALIRAIPEALDKTKRICSSVNVASTKAGINMDAVSLMGESIKKAAQLSGDRDGLNCAKMCVFSNIPQDVPFMAGAYLGTGEPDVVINVGVSGPGVVKKAIDRALQKDPDLNLGQLSEIIKRTAYKVTRVGELIGREVAQELKVPFGIVDLSLAPTPNIGDSVGEIFQSLGLKSIGDPGSTAVLALLNDAVKRGGAFASSHVGGLSGAFIPVSEDLNIARAVAEGRLSLEKLESMTSVCSVGLDMIAIPGDTTSETISAIIADEMAIGMINNKTTAARLIPVPGKKEGEKVKFGGLLGEATIMSISNELGSNEFARRGGRIPAPIQSLTN